VGGGPEGFPEGGRQGAGGAGGGGWPGRGQPEGGRARPPTGPVWAFGGGPGTRFGRLRCWGGHVKPPPGGAPTPPGGTPAGPPSRGGGWFSGFRGGRGQRDQSFVPPTFGAVDGPGSWIFYGEIRGLGKRGTSAGGGGKTGGGGEGGGGGGGGGGGPPFSGEGGSSSQGGGKGGRGGSRGGGWNAGATSGGAATGQRRFEGIWGGRGGHFFSCFGLRRRGREGTTAFGANPFLGFFLGGRQAGGFRRGERGARGRKKNRGGEKKGPRGGPRVSEDCSGGRNETGLAGVSEKEGGRNRKGGATPIRGSEGFLPSPRFLFFARGPGGGKEWLAGGGPFFSRGGTSGPADGGPKGGGRPTSGLTVVKTPFWPRCRKGRKSSRFEASLRRCPKAGPGPTTERGGATRENFFFGGPGVSELRTCRWTTFARRRTSRRLAAAGRISRAFSAICAHPLFFLGDGAALSQRQPVPPRRGSRRTSCCVGASPTALPRTEAVRRRVRCETTVLRGKRGRGSPRRITI